jgi:hypothetical protein
MRNMVLSVVACLAASTILANGLGDAARKEQEKRKKNAESGVKTQVIGNAELLSATEGKGTFSVSENTASSPEAQAGASAMPNVSSPTLGRTTSATSEANGSYSSAQPPSDYNTLKQKSEAWRARYRPAKERVDALEREVADLEKQAGRKASLPVGGIPGRPIRDAMGRTIAYEPPPTVVTESDTAKGLLPQRRQELARAKQELSSVEDGARRDGVGSGQLY